MLPGCAGHRASHDSMPCDAASFCRFGFVERAEKLHPIVPVLPRFLFGNLAIAPADKWFVICFRERDERRVVVLRFDEGVVDIMKLEFAFDLKRLDKRGRAEDPGVPRIFWDLVHKRSVRVLFREGSDVYELDDAEGVLADGSCIPRRRRRADQQRPAMVRAPRAPFDGFDFLEYGGCLQGFHGERFHGGPFDMIIVA